MPQIICQNLTLGYEGAIVVSDLSFTVDAGDYLCIVGENGSGKSTLMKAMLKLIKPVSGSVATGDGLEAGAIGYLPQQTSARKDFPASVREVVRTGCLNRKRLRPFYTKAEIRTADACMEKLGVAPLAKRCFRDLSDGQRQRALLARALCAARRVLLLDEPAAGLDPKATNDMYALAKQLNADGVTIVMISHDIREAVKYASHILHIGTRSTLFHGTKADYIGSETWKQYAAGGPGAADDPGMYKS